MTVAEARANVQGLLNLFQGLKSLGDSLDAAQAAETVLVERQALIDAKTKELADVSAAVDAAKLAEAQRSADVEAAHVSRLREQDAQMESITNSFASAQAALGAALTEQQAKYDADRLAFANEIHTLTVTRDDLTTSVSTLQDQLAQLKTSVASL